jgi:ribosomal protein S18 acetylase RimI-like enzyme
MTAFQFGDLRLEHRGRVRQILDATGAFRDDEVGVALELFDETYQEKRGDYEFVGGFGRDGELAGYVCYGPTPGTDRTYDLYWIAVHPDHQGTGGGSNLLAETEQRLCDRRARLLIVETSARTSYAETRRFYERRAYAERARLRDFYAPGDDRVIYAKRLDQ